MATVGLTGGIGSGKSVVAGIFSDLGAAVLDADFLARSALERGTPGFDQAVATFGDQILKDGQIDRRALGEIVFNNPQERAKLEAIVHPQVRALFLGAVAQTGAGEVLVYEIPLLVETSAAEHFDFIITVESDLETRHERLINRGLLSHEISARISAQATSEERIAQSDAVIYNNGSREELLSQVERIWSELITPLLRTK